MSVEFEEESFSVPDRTPNKTPGFSGVLIKLGIAKNTYVAHALLITLSVVLVGITLFIVMTSSGQKPIGPQVEDFYKLGKHYTPGVPLR